MAPWLAEAGYLTPLYLHRREQERIPCNMARWLSPEKSKHMLRPPAYVLSPSIAQIIRMLQIAAKCAYSTSTASQYPLELQRIAASFPPLPRSHDGYLVRLSESSPKDVTMTDAFLTFVCSKRAVQALPALHASDDDALLTGSANGAATSIQTKSWPWILPSTPSCVKDTRLRDMVQQIKTLWDQIAPTLAFTTCILDVYAEVHKFDFQAQLIEINPHGAHCGSGSLLYHWMDDAEILLPNHKALKHGSSPRRRNLRRLSDSRPEGSL
ncbi:hypothetical protein DOTSEDRAFT_38184 [Dothistroma septosporum NZE10]|uniref:Cell division cycle protein 123 n=1 Tax=Dothistroma septosporum (strain NZE10 / CBS 128990) TaxID=675120 RepID=N1PDN1_DOTSN|nr:hypothetical protein DOTSEDRAFT_38184 [Dothistroma septosporum NZE10]